MSKKYITQDKLKKNTLADIVIFILEKKQTTRREIEHETGFSWGTVSANVAFLLICEKHTKPDIVKVKTHKKIVKKIASLCTLFTKPMLYYYS